MLLKNTQRRRKRNQEGSWAVSYVDMLTLLLCFFIIFYNNQKNTKQETLLDKIAADLGNRKPGSTSTKATAMQAPIPETKMVPAIPYEVALLESIKTTLAKDFGANIIAKDKGLEINFDGVSFFNSGRTQLSSEGAKTIEKIIHQLAPNKDQIHVTVQGHTDPTKTNAKLNFQDNWELSVLRATSVLKMFIKNGYSQKMLSAEGFADTRYDQNVGTLTKEDLAKMRRVTLRIEPMKVKQ